MSAQILFLDEAGAANLVSVAVNMEGRRGIVLKRYRAVIDFQNDCAGLGVVRGGKGCDVVKDKCIVVLKAEDRIPAVAKLIDEHIVTSSAQE